jgi:hypothetical protein
VIDALRKCIAVLSVLLVITAFRCTATCLVGDAGSSAHTNAPAVPPCHEHHKPAQGTRNPVPCQDHPGLLAYSIHQAAAQIDLHVNLLPVYGPAPLILESWKQASGIYAYAVPIPRSEALSSIVLRI